MHKLGLIRAALFGIGPVAALALAGCDKTSAPVPEGTPATETAIEASVAVSSETVPTDNATGNVRASATPSEPAAAPSRTPAAVAPKLPKAASPAPAASPKPRPSPTPTVSADPHAGHDMSTMSDEDMKQMGHN